MENKGDLEMVGKQQGTISVMSELGFERSERIDALATALAKAQGAMESAKKDSANPFFKSKYADLASVWRACREELTKNGLSIVQMPTGGPTPLGVTTMLAHSSGQYIASSFKMEGKKSDPQSLGSLITYAKRYALSAMVGLSTEDDDGAHASGRVHREPQRRPAGNATMLEAFKQIGYDRGHIEDYIGKAIEEITKEDNERLKAYYLELKGNV